MNGPLSLYYFQMGKDRHQDRYRRAPDPYRRERRPDFSRAYHLTAKDEEFVLETMIQVYPTTRPEVLKLVVRRPEHRRNQPTVGVFLERCLRDVNTGLTWYHPGYQTRDSTTSHRSQSASSSHQSSTVTASSREQETRSDRRIITTASSREGHVSEPSAPARQHSSATSSRPEASVAKPQDVRPREPEKRKSFAEVLKSPPPASQSRATAEKPRAVLPKRPQERTTESSKTEPVRCYMLRCRAKTHGARKHILKDHLPRWFNPNEEMDYFDRMQLLICTVNKVMRVVGVESPEGLIQLAKDQGWYPTLHHPVPLREDDLDLIQAFDKYTGRREYPVSNFVSVSPPSITATVVHWRLFSTICSDAGIPSREYHLSDLEYQETLKQAEEARQRYKRYESLPTAAPTPAPPTATEVRPTEPVATNMPTEPTSSASSSLTYDQAYTIMRSRVLGTQESPVVIVQDIGQPMDTGSTSPATSTKEEPVEVTPGSSEH